LHAFAPRWFECAMMQRASDVAYSASKSGTMLSLLNQQPFSFHVFKSLRPTGLSFLKLLRFVHATCPLELGIHTGLTTGHNEDKITTAALVIAISAFVVACGQLLQQLFATADGLRRCQNSVIGGLSKLVQLRSRWSVGPNGRKKRAFPNNKSRNVCRFEIRVTTPHFEIAQLTWEYVGRWPKEEHVRRSSAQKLAQQVRGYPNLGPTEPLKLVGTDNVYQWSMSPNPTPGRTDRFTEGTVTWLSLLMI
jgi:hypothetical protein